MIKISDKEETLPSLRDRPRKLFHSGILSVKYAECQAEVSGGIGDDSCFSPSFAWDGDFPSAEKREESGKVFTVIAG